jgi:hypothetical protein
MNAAQGSAVLNFPVIWRFPRSLGIKQSYEPRNAAGDILAEFRGGGRKIVDSSKRR